MHATRSERRSVQRRRRLAIIVGGGVVAALAVAAALVVPGLINSNAAPEAGAETTATTKPASPTPTPTPLTPAEQLLASTDDPNACVVSLAGDGVSDAPVLETQGIRYTQLPIPAAAGQLFAGWYSTAEDAAAYNSAARVNGADVVACTEQQITLYGSWMTPEQAAATPTEVPILMYHWMTELPEGEDHWLKLNYIYTGDFDAQLGYIAEQGFYLPTWAELSSFIDGTLYLPPKSVIITDDDGDPTWFRLGEPIVDKHKLMTTAFIITIYGDQPSSSIYIDQRSHTHDMHTAGDNGQGRIVNWTPEQIAADLETSAQILHGAKEVVAYPFGHFNDTAKQGVLDAGYTMARTIDWGYVTPGTDKLALPVIRMNYGMTVADLASLIG